MATDAVTTTEDPERTELRDRARAWLAAHAAPRRTRSADDAPREAPAPEAERLARARAFQVALHDAGFAGITWPREWGGQGLTWREQLAFNEEAAAFELPTSPFVIGLGMCGPTILAHGTDDQRARYLRPLLRGEETWCQLFSEPSAGSDVAALATRAVRDGDEWVVDGQKVWTSGAHYSDFGILLARTDPDVPKHRGLTMFILDMHTPGVEVRPLRQMSGESDFNEVFLSGARIPADHVVGSLGEGWRVAMTTLMNERVAVSSGTGGTGTDAHGLVRLARQYGRSGDPVVRQALARLWSTQATLGYLRDRIRAAVRAGRPPGPEGSVAKLAASRLALQAASTAVAIAGPDACAWDAKDPRGDRWSRRLAAAPGASIGGGTDAVLRNIIGERVLALPKEPQVDRDIPWRDIAAIAQRMSTTAPSGNSA